MYIRNNFKFNRSKVLHIYKKNKLGGIHSMRYKEEKGIKKRMK